MRRTNMEILGDAVKILSFAKDASSFNELSQMTNLSYKQIITSLSSRQLNIVRHYIEINEKKKEDDLKSKLPNTITVVDGYTPILTTFPYGQISDNALIISELATPVRKALVISGNREQSFGSCKLKIQDEIFICAKRDNYISFSHYCIIKEELNNNSFFIYGIKLYNRKAIKILPFNYQRIVRKLCTSFDVFT